MFFQTRINEAFLTGEGSVAWNIVRSLKFVIYSLSAPAALVGIWFVAGKHRQLWLSLAAFIYLLALLVVVNYYDYFGMVPHWNQFANLDEAGNVGGHILAQLIGWEDVLSIISVALGCGVMAVFLKKPTNWLRFSPLVLSIPALALLCVQLKRYPILPRVNGYGYTLACSHYGIWPTYAVMLKDFIPRKPRVVAFPHERVVRGGSESEGMLRSQNVIVLQIESLDSGLVGRRIGDEPVMPFLEKIAGEGVFFPDCVAMHAGGGSSDAELSSLLSLVPLTIGSGFSTADWDRVTPVSELLNERGYTCVGLHPNRGSFFERSKRYQLMGFSTFHDQKSFSGDASGWYSKDMAFFSQSVKKLTELPEPFFAYFITMQSHGPFQNFKPSTRSKLRDKVAGLPRLEQDYLCTFREVDEALEELFTDLKNTGLLDSSLVLIFGDHESGVVKNDVKGEGERVPLIFSHPKLDAARHDRLVSHMDVAPTIVDLLGMEADQSWLGVSVFSRGPKEQVVLPSGMAVTPTSSERNEDALQVLDYSRSLLGH